MEESRRPLEPARASRSRSELEAAIATIRVGGSPCPVTVVWELCSASREMQVQGAQCSDGARGRMGLEMRGDVEFPSYILGSGGALPPMRQSNSL